MPAPLIRSLPADFSMEQAFLKFCGRPGCLWLDSASKCSKDQTPQGKVHAPLGRYSFLTSDPIDRLVAFPGDENPWPKLHRWHDRLPANVDSALPPFQGGIAGLIGYEAASWLEQVDSTQLDDLPTPAMSLGLYDWVIAVDHLTGKSWIIAQGWDPDTNDAAPLCSVKEIAEARIHDVQTILNSPAPDADFGSSDLGAADGALLRCQHATSIPGVSSNFSGAEFRTAVAEIVRRIRSGDSFQVNLAQRLIRRADQTSPELYRLLRSTNPAPLGAFYDGGEFQVLSSSPEGFLRVHDRKVETRPIKGTVRRTGHEDVDLKLSQKLAASVKDRAENVMIVDLMRNDLSRVCDDESVIVTQLCEIERYEYVQHLVSVVQATLNREKSVVDLLEACFPGGSVTGAPKIEAMRTIAQLEKIPRGPYCGSIGYIGCGGRAEFNILIRTITAASGYWQIPVGGGITAKSEPETEEYETWSKATGMLKAMQKQTSSVVTHREEREKPK